MRNSYYLVFVSVCIITTSCDNNRSAENNTDILSLSMNPTSSGLLQDSINTIMYSDIKSKHANKQAEKIGTYGVFKIHKTKDKKGDIFQKANKLGILGDKLWDGDGNELDPGKSYDASDKQWLVKRDSNNELMINNDSGYSIWIKHNKYFKSARKKQADIHEDVWYVEQAKKYIAKYKDIFPVYNEIYPYKIMRATTSHVENLVQSGAFVNQIDVAFNQLIDGVPILGNGGKYVVSMDTEGNLVGYQAHPIEIEKRIKDIKGEDTVDPTLAEDTTRKKFRNDKPEYDIARSDFGYLVRGRNTSQDYLIPTYSYILRHISRDGSYPVNAETVDASNDIEIKYLAQLDQTSESIRKDKQKGDVKESTR